MSCPPASAKDGFQEKFSLPLFLLTVAGTLSVLFVIIRFAFPGIWAEQLGSSFGRWATVFFAVSLLNCYLEYFFHRYVLHTAAVPLLSRLYRQHTLHHSLTRIVRKRAPQDGDASTIENLFPILESAQGEASFFPWFTLAAFALAIAPVLALAQWLFPSFPWFFSGYAALSVSLILYEVLHAANHWSLETWVPLIRSPRWGWFWRPAYSFHLRHHAAIDCNESISGFFGFPLADWTFRTCTMPKTLYAQGEEWSPEKFEGPRPRWPISAIDRWAERTVRQRRESTGIPANPGSWGERMGVGLMHVVGLGLSVAGLALLVVFSSLRGDAWHVVSFSVFGAALLSLHAALTLCHVWQGDRGRQLMRRLGHVAGFGLVAATYTPFLLTSIRGPRGWTVFGIAWGLCGAGAALDLAWGERFRFSRAFRWLTAGLLLAMVLKPLAASMPLEGVWLLVAGGVCYVASATFPRWRGLRYHRMVGHGWAVLGGVCHVMAALLFLLPHAA